MDLFLFAILLGFIPGGLLAIVMRRREQLRPYALISGGAAACFSFQWYFFSFGLNFGGIPTDSGEVINFLTFLPMVLIAFYALYLRLEEPKP